MAQGDPYIASFRFVGRDAFDEVGMSGTYEVILAKWITDPEGVRKPIYSKALTPARATALGFNMQSLMGAANLQLSQDLAAMTAQRDALQQQLETAQAQLSQASGQLTALNAAMKAAGVTVTRR